MCESCFPRLLQKPSYGCWGVLERGRGCWDDKTSHSRNRHAMTLGLSPTGLYPECVFGFQSGPFMAIYGLWSERTQLRTLLRETPNASSRKTLKRSCKSHDVAL